MPLQQIRLKPGIVRNGTNLSNEGSWWHCDKVRFWFGLPQKLGGWVRMIGDTFGGIARLLITWIAFNPSNELVGLGTSEAFYIVTTGAAYDITPIAETSTLALNSLSSTSGSDIVTVHDSGHGLFDGQFVIISGAADFNGLLASEINAKHRIDAIDIDTYNIRVTTPATATGAGGGTITTNVLVYAGPDIAQLEGGWGASPWGGRVGALDTTSDETDDVGWGGTYSKRRLTEQPGLWSADVFGNDLFINPRGRAIYYWQYSNGAGLNVPAVELSTLATTLEKPWIPQKVSYILTNDLYNFLLAYGTQPVGTDDDLDPLFIRWSDQNNFFDWEPRIDNQAGGIRLSSGSQILCALKTRQETLVFTDTSVYAQQYIGPPLVFSFALLSNNVSLIGPNAGTVFNGVAYWMGAGRFYKYDGQVQPLACPILDLVVEELDITQGWQVYCNYNERFREIIWFFCSLATPEDIPDRYLIYNPYDETWVYGTMTRSAWQYSTHRSLPIAAQPSQIVDEFGDDRFTSKLLLHEVGYDDQSESTPVPITAFIESSDFDIAEGHQFSFVDKVLPDIDFGLSTAVNPVGFFGLDVRNAPGANYRDPERLGITRFTTQPVQQFTEQLNFRLRGRQIKMTFGSDELGVAWQFGPPRVGIRQDGRR